MIVFNARSVKLAAYFSPNFEDPTGRELTNYSEAIVSSGKRTHKSSDSVSLVLILCNLQITSMGVCVCVCNVSLIYIIYRYCKNEAITLCQLIPNVSISSALTFL